jgi:hypothetical protein
MSRVREREQGLLHAIALRSLKDLQNLPYKHLAPPVNIAALTVLRRYCRNALQYHSLVRISCTSRGQKKNHMRKISLGSAAEQTLFERLRIVQEQWALARGGSEVDCFRRKPEIEPSQASAWGR